MYDKYYEWLSNNSNNWSERTVQKYSSAVRIISKEMLEKGVISKSLFNMDRLELERAFFLIFNDTDFIKKDTIGKCMYSNGLKHYRAFIAEQNLNNLESVKEIENHLLKDKTLSETEKEVIISARIGQGIFRKKLIDKYGKCLITEVDDCRLLIASHIKPWAVSNNYERISVNNGLLLTPTFDKLFDMGLISFNKDDKLIVSTFIGKENEKKLHIPNGEKFLLPKNQEFYQNMEYHRDVLFVK